MWSVCYRGVGVRADQSVVGGRIRTIPRAAGSERSAVRPDFALESVRAGTFELHYETLGSDLTARTLQQQEIANID